MQHKELASLNLPTYNNSKQLDGFNSVHDRHFTTAHNYNKLNVLNMKYSTVNKIIISSDLISPCKSKLCIASQCPALSIFQ